MDAELFAEFTTCAIDMARKGQAAAKVRRQSSVQMAPSTDRLILPQHHVSMLGLDGPAQMASRISHCMSSSATACYERVW